MATTQARPPSPTPSQLPPVPASPTYSYASTANPISAYNLPLPPPPRAAHAVLTKSDLEQSQAAYAEVLSSAKSYRLALAALSTAASAFGSALESCARLKEARADALGPPAAASLSNSFNAKGSCTADSLLAAAGVHHLVANHQQILSETVYRSFEVPLLHELDKWRRDVEDEEEGYVRAVKKQSQEIRRLEKEGLKLHRQRRRDVAKFRSHLVELTTKLDGLTTLNAEHARTLLRESQDTSVKILDASCSLVRAEVDIFESLARKGWSGGGLDDLLEKGTDLFASDDAAGDGSGGINESSKLFSILPPKSILADSASDTAARQGHFRGDSLTDAAIPYQSLSGAMSQPRLGADTDSVFSEVARSRMIRPFSPPPVKVNPEDVMGDGIGESSSSMAKALEESRARFKLPPGDLTPEEEEEEQEEDQPWRKEGRNSGEQDTPSASMQSSQQRERRWSVNEDQVD